MIDGRKFRTHETQAGRPFFLHFFHTHSPALLAFCSLLLRSYVYIPLLFYVPPLRSSMFKFSGVSVIHELLFHHPSLAGLRNIEALVLPIHILE